MADYSDKGLWHSTYGPYRPSPPLTGSIEADVAIVGGGFTGMATAYYLLKAEPSLKVVVLESEVVGYGASGRNGSFAMTVVGLGLDVLVKLKGRERVKQAGMLVNHHAAVDAGAKIYDGDKEVGVVTTASYSRLLMQSLAMVHLHPSRSSVGAFRNARAFSIFTRCGL